MTRTQITWRKEEDEILLVSVSLEGRKNWKSIATLLDNKTPIQCFYIFRKINPVIVKTKWTQTEDNLLLQLHRMYGNNWSKISKVMKSRGPKQIRDRFINNLDPKIKRGNFTISEDLKILKLKNVYGNKWSLIANQFADRSPDIIKSRYYSSVKNKKELLFFLDSLDNVKELNCQNVGNLSLDDVNLDLFGSVKENIKNFHNNFITEQNNYIENCNISIAKTNFLSSSELSSEMNCNENYNKFSEINFCQENVNFN